MIKISFKNKYLKLTISILICQLAGIIGSFFTASSIKSWYVQLNRPSFNPPNWVFGPVWITLYFLMGISLFIIWNKKSDDSKKTIYVFMVHLFFNTIWSIIFFGLHSIMFAFIDIVLLWIAILVTMFYFYKISKPAVYLLVPYFLWVSFAAVLNFEYLRIN